MSLGEPKRKKKKENVGINPKRKPSEGVAVGRAYYPSGPHIDAYGNIVKSPNTPTDPPRPATNDLVSKNKKFKTSDGNPDPNNWKFVKVEEHGKYLILMMEYPDCSNYEGKKILVFENITLIQLVNQKLIDPHFFPATSNYKSPIARFEPTDRGWEMAKTFIAAMSSGLKR